MLERAVGTAGALAVSALETLKEVMRDPTAPAAARVSGAKALLEHLLRGREASTLSDRLAALEQALESGPRPSTSLLPAPRTINR